MMSGRFLAMLVASFLLQTCTAIPGLSKIRGMIRGLYANAQFVPHMVDVCVTRGLVRPNAPDVVPEYYLGAEPVGDYSRKTQSPMVWCDVASRSTALARYAA